MSESAETDVSAESIQVPLAEDAARNQRWNFWVSVIEGGAFIGGCTFLNAQTLLPDIIRQLGGSDFLIALSPSLIMVGFMVCPVLTAHWVDGMKSYMPLLTWTGLLQRIVYLFAAVALFLAAAGIFTKGALVAVVAAPLLCGIAGGMSVTAWQQLTARCIPERRRASAFALRYILTCILGVIAGLTVKYLLAHFTLLTAYGTLHLITFTFIMVSYFVFLMTREPAGPAAGTHTLTLSENLKLMPGLVAQDSQFRLYLLSRFFRNGSLVIIPFLAIYARQHLGEPESFLGILLVANMLGAITGNLGAAWLGDRFGGKLPNQLALALYTLIAVWAIFAGTRTEFMAIFFLMGTAFYAGEVGATTLMLEILPLPNRATYLAITSLTNFPAVLAAGWVSSTISRRVPGITWLAVITIVTMAISMALLHPIKEPRKARRPELATA